MNEPERMELEQRIRDLERKFSESCTIIEKLRTEVERSRRFLDDLPQPIFEVDGTGRVTYANKKTSNLFGFTGEDIKKGMSAFDMLAPEYRKMAANLIPKVMSGEMKSGTEYRIIKRNGECFPGVVYTVPVITSDGTPGLRGIILDITKTRHAEQALRESDERFRLLLDSIPGISIRGYDPCGVVRYWNKGSELLFGYTTQEALGKKLADIIVPEDVIPYLNQALVTGGAMTRSGEFMPPGELTLHHKNGELVTVYSIHNVVCVENKPPLMFCFDMDLSERKRIENDLRQRAERALHLQTVLLDLAKGDFPDTSASMRRILDIAANALGIRQTGIWWFNPMEYTIVLGEVSSQYPESPGVDTVIFMGEQSGFFHEVEKNRVIVVENDCEYPAAEGHFTDFMQRNGITSLLLVPIWIHGEFIGILSSEYTGRERNWTHEEQQFVVSVADIIALARESSDRRMAEDALRESDERFRMLIDSVPGISIQGYDTDGIVRYWNRASELIYGYTAEEALGKNLGDLIIPEDVKPHFRQALEFGKTLSRSGEFMPAGELVLVHKNGSPVPVYSIHTAVCVENKKPLMFCLDVDLSGQKHVEALLRHRAERALHLQAVLLDLAKGNFPDIPAAVRRILDIAADALEIERTGVWWYNPAEYTIVCGEISSQYGKLPDKRVTISMCEQSIFFRAVEENRVIMMEEGMEDLLAAGFMTDYMRRNGITSILLVPIWIHGEFIGILSIEHTGLARTWTPEEQQFAVSVADIIALARESTDRRAAEEALRASEKRYRDIFELIPISIWEYDFSDTIQLLDALMEEGICNPEEYLNANPEILKKYVESLRLVDVNRETVLMYGARSKEEIFRDYGRHRLQELSRAYCHIASEYMAGHRFIKIETVNETIDGRKIDIVLQITFTEETRRSGRALVTVLNVTDQKNAEKALRASEEKFRSIVEQSTDGIALVDEDGLVTEWNPGIERITGIPREDAIGIPIWDLIFRTMADGKKAAGRIGKYREFIHDIISTGDVPQHMKFMEVTLRRPDSGIRVIQQVVSPVKTGRGHTLIVTTRDVTEFKQLEEERMKAGKLESVGLLAGGIAHDFNNILVSILGHISLAKSCLEPVNPASELLRKAEKAGFRARDLTRQLLTFSKGGSPVKEASSIVEIIRDAVEFSLRGTNVRCEFSLPDDLSDADVDRGQMNQVMNNLILNAWQAMPDGGVIFISAANSRITMSEGLPLTPGHYIIVTVRDTGIGIPSDVLPRIFDPYFTTKRDGSGLGLATAYSIMKGHGGYISAESREGAGTVFRLYIPAAKGTAVRQKEPEIRIPDIRGRVLIMDDEEGVREVAQAMLIHLGHEAETVPDGESAIARYREAYEAGRPFDVVIMDLTIPGGMGGKAAVWDLLQYDPSALAIVSSGYSEDSILAEHEKHGFRGVITKPYRIEDLREELNRVMGEKTKQ